MSSQRSDDTALQFLAKQGWLPLVLGDHAGFVKAFTSLQHASKTFFALPDDSEDKAAFQAASGASASEEGYSKILGEKSILTVKTASHCPNVLSKSVAEAWTLTGDFMEHVLQSIAKSLELDPDVFSPFVEPCKSLPDKNRTPTLLRLFRYDRPIGSEVKINAEKHKDLGLLSLVVGHSPGLMVIDSSTGRWVPVEEDSALPPDAKSRSGGFTATLLVGETLAFLSRGKYQAGVHAVECAPPLEGYRTRDENERYRYSMVFALRPAVAPLWTKNFESDVTGRFEGCDSAQGESSDVLFERIRSSHYNVNIAPGIRNKQRQEQIEEHARRSKGTQVSTNPWSRCLRCLRRS